MPKLFDKRSGCVDGVSFTVYENGLLKVGTTSSRKCVRLKEGQNVEEAVRQLAACQRDEPASSSTSKRPRTGEDACEDEQAGESYEERGKARDEACIELDRHREQLSQLRAKLCELIEAAVGDSPVEGEPMQRTAAVLLHAAISEDALLPCGKTHFEPYDLPMEKPFKAYRGCCVSNKCPRKRVAEQQRAIQSSAFAGWATEQQSLTVEDGGAVGVVGHMEFRCATGA
ncbi:hypothetical protein AB1Y20_018569 [Prymnesium parvum]|uniref:Uncharacterized protein n=1 Tax=Prymnesium parvum TaxID=97485 RepID=A0AB34JRT2_PRYPA